MYSPYCAFAIFLVVFAAHSVQSWDVGVVSATQIDFLHNKIIKKTVPVQWENVKAHTYDYVDDDMYFSEESTKSKNGTICRLKLTNDQATAEVVAHDEMHNIPDLAFNDRLSTLYWISGNTIKHLKIKKSRIAEPSKGNVLFELKDSTPTEIEIDTCRGYLYWINWLNSNQSSIVTIERSQLDGSDRKVLFYFNAKVLLYLTMDTAENRLYWAVLDPSKKRNHFNVYSSDLDGSSTKTVMADVDHMPRGVTTDEKNIYWLNSRTKSIWTMPKDGSRFPVEIIEYGDKILPVKIVPANTGRRACVFAARQQYPTAPIKSMLRLPVPITYESEDDDVVQLNLTNPYSKMVD